MDNKAYVALGTNIEPRYNFLKDALSKLDQHGEIIVNQKSSIYQTAPVGYTNQADFLNMVVEVTTSLRAEQLLDTCQEIEQHLGRKREIRFGPRTIDLDILVYNEENSKTERLILPHPRMHERAFVLVPLNEIAPHVLLPSSNETVESCLSKLPENDKKDVTIWTQQELADE